MSSDRHATLIARTDRVLKDLEDAEIERLNNSLDASYLQLERELLRRYPNYTAEAKPNLLATQRGVLLSEELKELLVLINGDREAELEQRFQRLLQTSSQEGTTLSQELIKLQTSEDFVLATATIPIEAVAFAAKDAVKRLKKHDQRFQEEATALITQGLIQGQGARKVAGFMRQRLGVTKGRAETIARTEIISAQDSATRANYKANGIEHVQRIATQDERVCPYCAARAGQVYLIDQAPAAIHPNDRCYNAPWMPEWEESDQTDDDWVERHAKDAQSRVEKPNFDLAPFERAAGIATAAKSVWQPGKGFIDKELEARGQSHAVALLAAALLLRGRSPAAPAPGLPTPIPFPIPFPIPIPIPINPFPPREEENEQLNALAIGAAIAGLSIAAYIVARKRYRDGFKDSARMAEEMLGNIDLNDLGENDQITIVAGGFAGMNGKSGAINAKQYGKFLRKHLMVGVDTSEFDVGPAIEKDALGHIAQQYGGMVNTAVVKGRNQSSVRMAATAAAYYRKYGKPVNLVGWSGGGMVAAEAHEILREMGIPVKTAALGTPWFGFTDIPSSEHLTLFGKGDIFSNLPAQNRVVLDRVGAHDLTQYLEDPQFVEVLQNWFDLDNPTSPPRTTYPTEYFVSNLNSLTDYFPQLGRFANSMELFQEIDRLDALPDPDRQKTDLLRALLVGSAIADVRVSAYYLARQRYRSGFKDSARMAEKMISEIDLQDLGDKERVGFIAGGFAGHRGTAGAEYVPYFSQILTDHHLVGVPTPEFDVDVAVEQLKTPVDSIQHISRMASKTLGTAIVEGRNMSAVRMAAMAAAYYRKYGKPISLVGYSSGGMVTAEAGEILKEMGVPFKAATVGTPWFGFTNLSAEEHRGFIGDKDQFTGLPVQNRRTVAAPNHLLDSYLLSHEFIREMWDWFEVRPSSERRSPGSKIQVPDAAARTTDLSVAEVVDATFVDLIPQLALLSEEEIKALPPAIARRLLQARRDAGILTGRADPKALPGIPQPKALPGYGPLLALPEARAARAVLRGQLPDLEPRVIPLGPVTEVERRGFENRMAQNLYKQARSFERGMARLAEGRIRQAIAQINKQQLPPAEKLKALRQAVLGEIQAIATPVELQPPGAKNQEALTKFTFAGADWHAPGELKETSAVLDLARKFAELDLPNELVQNLEEVYITRQKNAHEQFWRKRLRLITPRVPATVQLETGAITFYRTHLTSLEVWIKVLAIL